MAMKQADAEELLREFASFPREKIKRTYLEICRYPYNRFEEICSRILCFYFNPKENHGFKDLFLTSMVEIMGIKDKELELTREVQIHLEEYSGGKRLYLIIEGKDFIIGIENKIYASLYNDLANYRTKIEAYKKPHTYGIILSLNKLTKEELVLVKKYNYLNVTYKDFFNKIKKNIGLYLKNIDNTYFIYLNDFITTITNMNSSNMESNLSGFFQKNSAQIEELIESYNLFRGNIIGQQQTKISELYEKIAERTDGHWWIYQGYDLGCQIYGKDGYYLGVESEFISEANEPFAKFAIKLSAWRKKDWDYFHKRISTVYPTKNSYKEGAKTQINLEIINGKDEDTILLELEKAYNLLNQIVSE